MKMKKLLALVLTLAMTLSMLSMTAFAAEENTAVPISAVTDTETPAAPHWAAAAADRWSAAGVIMGNESGDLRLDAEITRGEIATIFVKLLGLTQMPAANPYADLKGDEWYADAMLKCTEAGIMVGDGRNCNGENKITRQETAVIIAREL